MLILAAMFDAISPNAIRPGFEVSVPRDFCEKPGAADLNQQQALAPNRVEPVVLSKESSWINKTFTSS